MAKRKSERPPRTAAEEGEREAPEGSLIPDKGEDALALASAEEPAEAATGAADEAGADDVSGEAGSGDDLLAARVGDGEAGPEDEGVAAAQLGTERYVLAGFFATGMLSAYILGKFVHGVWGYASNKDWFSQTFPRLAAVPDDNKTSYSLVIGGIAALILVFRIYRRPDVRTWSEEVAAELAKVKWPTKKEVSNSTVVVIAASAVATIYLALLDRLWGFITNLVYGDGS